MSITHPPSIRLSAWSKTNGSIYIVTNNPDLAEKQLRKQGYTHISRASEQSTFDVTEVMYFDKGGEIVPLGKLTAEME